MSRFKVAATVALVISAGFYFLTGTDTGGHHCQISLECPNIGDHANTVSLLLQTGDGCRMQDRTSIFHNLIQ